MADQGPGDQQQGSQQGAEVLGGEGPQRGSLSTGNVALDEVLRGGIPRGSLCIITGPPGAGKTILAQQCSFAVADMGLRVIYFTNVSEPHAKLIEHAQGFTFFQASLLGSQIKIYNITSQIRNKGVKETFDFIVGTVRNERADLVVIDSFRGLKHVLEFSARERGSIFDLAAQLSILGCTSLLIGEYTALEMQTDPEFAIADGIIRLSHTIDSVQAHRSLRVIKLRGVGYLGGEHSFAIDHHGLAVYPRQEALIHAPSYRATNERISVGQPELDAMLHGGLIRSSSTLLAGSAGTGKTLISLHFLAAGAQDGERGLMLSFQENPEQLRVRAAQFGLDQRLGFDERRTLVLSISPVELNIDATAAQIRTIVAQGGIRRVVIDSVAELESATHDPERFDDFLGSLIGLLRSYEVTTLMTREIRRIFGTDLTIAGQGLSYIVDNIILLRYIELQSEIRRAIAVLKSRGSDHDKRLRELHLSNGQISIRDDFEQFSGIMTGQPTFIGELDPTFDEDEDEGLGD